MSKIIFQGFYLEIIEKVILQGNNTVEKREEKGESWYFSRGVVLTGTGSSSNCSSFMSIALCNLSHSSGEKKKKRFKNEDKKISPLLLCVNDRYFLAYFLTFFIKPELAVLNSEILPKKVVEMCCQVEFFSRTKNPTFMELFSEKAKIVPVFAPNPFHWRLAWLLRLFCLAEHLCGKPFYFGPIHSGLF